MCWFGFGQRERAWGRQWFGFGFKERGAKISGDLKQIGREPGPFALPSDVFGHCGGRSTMVSNPSFIQAVLAVLLLLDLQRNFGNILLRVLVCFFCYLMSLQRYFWRFVQDFVYGFFNGFFLWLFYRFFMNIFGQKFKCFSMERQRCERGNLKD